MSSLPGFESTTPPRKRKAAQAWALWRALTLTAGRAAVLRAAPLYAGILVVSGVLFGGNGLDARTVTDAAARSPGFRVILLTVWLLASTPAARALLHTRAALYLRTLPVPHWQFYGVHTVHLLLAELPVLLLWGRGAGLVATAALLPLLLAAHVVLVAGLRRDRDGVLGVLFLAAAAAPLPALLQLMVGASGYMWALPLAFRRAAANEPPAERPWVSGKPPLALLRVHLLTLWRTQRALLLRALLLYALALAIAWLAARNNRISRPAELAALMLTVAAVLAPAALLGLSGPVLRSERQLVWLLDTCATTAGTRVLAAAGAVALSGAVLGGLYGGLLALLYGNGLRLGGEGVLLGLLQGALLMGPCRWALRGDKRDGNRMVLVGVLAGLGGPVATWVMGELVLAAWAVAAGGLLLRSLPLAFPATRSGRLRLAKLRAEHELESLPGQ